MRRWLIDHVWVEEVTVTNHRHEHSEVRLALDVDADFADLFAERLLDEQLYSGWGVRTLGTQEAGYNPLGYHNRDRGPTRIRSSPLALGATATARRRAPSPPRSFWRRRTSSTACPRYSPATPRR